MICARAGCKRSARSDEFCSTRCAKLHYGCHPPVETQTPHGRRKLNALREKYPHGVEVENMDAMTRRVPGSFESNQ